jgi:hypothetical protein
MVDGGIISASSWHGDAVARRGEPAMVYLYAVVGEHGTDPDLLLVLGEDGQHYAWALATDETTPVNVDERWRIDAVPLDRMSLRDPSFAEQISL